MLFSSKKISTSQVSSRSSSNFSSSSSSSSTSSSVTASSSSSPLSSKLCSFSNPNYYLSMASKVNASGDGLSSGKTGEVASFSIVGTPPIEKDDTKFEPTACSCAFEGPSKPEIKFTANNLAVQCDWIPKLPGNYKIYVRYNDDEIKGSPFMAKVTGGEDIATAETKKIKVAGKALTEGRTKLSNEVIIDTRSSLIIGGLSVSMEGPAKPEISFKKNEKDGTFVLTYKPDTAGEYK